MPASPAAASYHFGIAWLFVAPSVTPASSAPGARSGPGNRTPRSSQRTNGVVVPPAGSVAAPAGHPGRERAAALSARYRAPPVTTRERPSRHPAAARSPPPAPGPVHPPHVMDVERQGHVGRPPLDRDKTDPRLERLHRPAQGQLPLG